jgi:hypothetical protein
MPEETRMKNQQASSTSRLATLKWLPTLFFLVAAGCGGGGGSDPVQGGTPAPAPAPAPTPAPAPAMPTVVDGGPITGTSVVGASQFASGPTATGGNGQPVGSVNCTFPAIQTFAYYTHVQIWQNGTQIGLPDRAGVVGVPPTCFYSVHTHTGDRSGRIHKEGPDDTKYTLGQFFAVWGMPLTATDVAGITGLPLTVYLIDSNRAITQFTGDPATIELASHLHIALVLGTPVNQLYFYTW